MCSSCVEVEMNEIKNLICPQFFSRFSDSGVDLVIAASSGLTMATLVLDFPMRWMMISARRMKADRINPPNHKPRGK